MKQITKLIGVAISVGFGHLSANAEDWAYVGQYPWIYTYSTNTWLYLPSSQQMVWDYSVDNWALNPLDSASFDVTDTLDAVPVIVNLVVPESDTTIEIGFNYSGVEGGTFKIGDVTHSIDVAWVTDAQTGTCQLYGSWTEDDSDSGSFSLLLDFDSLTSGSYTLIGNLGLDSAKVSTFKGSFSVPTE